MASQQKLGLWTEWRSGPRRVDHHHSAALGPHLMEWQSCVEVRPDAVIWKIWMTPVTRRHMSMQRQTACAERILDNLSR